ncbi:MAG TPA: hypothetical protein PKN69_07315, partial [Candidatus Latescibacteria bacterium]|nr:hypothetical protein [Candidatus Latescibacterota bacterium]
MCTRILVCLFVAFGLGRVARADDALRTLPDSFHSGHTSWVGSLAITPDGETIVSGGGDKTIRVWRRNDRALLQTL